MSREAVIARYQADYLLFLHAIESVPERKKSENVFNQWRINELVAHVAFWNLETIRAIQKTQEGEIPWFFDDEKKINTINQQVVDSRQNVSLSSLLKELEENHTALIGFLEALPEEGFHRASGQLWKTQAVTPSLVCSYRHYLDHAKDILDWLEIGNP